MQTKPIETVRGINSSNEIEMIWEGHSNGNRKQNAAECSRTSSGGMANYFQLIIPIISSAMMKDERMFYFNKPISQY